MFAAIAVLVAAGIAAYSAHRQGKKNREAQENANNANVANQQAMWEQTNEYNDPTNQMMRLQKAGLNPNLIYGSAQPYNTASNQNMPDQKALEYNNPFENLPSAITDYSNITQQERRLSNETLVATTGAANTAQETANKKIQGAKSQFDLDQGRRLADGAFDVQQLQIRQAQADAVNKEIQNQQLPEAHKKMLQEANQRMSLMGSQMNTEQLRRQQIELEMDLKKAGLENAPWWSRFIMRNMGEAKDGVYNWINRTGGLPIKLN